MTDEERQEIAQAINQMPPGEAEARCKELYDKLIGIVPEQITDPPQELSEAELEEYELLKKKLGYDQSATQT